MANSEGQSTQQAPTESSEKSMPDNVISPDFNELKDTRGGGSC